MGYPGSLRRRDRHRHRPDGSGDPYDHEYGNAAVGFGTIWMLDFVRGVLHRFATATGERLEPFRVGPHPNGIMTAEGSVWVWNRHGRWLRRLDPATGVAVAS